MTRHLFMWRGILLDKLSREERQRVREFVERDKERFREELEEWPTSLCRPFPREAANGNADELLRRLDELDYIEATQFTLLGAADERWRR